MKEKSAASDQHQKVDKSSTHNTSFSLILLSSSSLGESPVELSVDFHVLVDGKVFLDCPLPS